MREFKLECIVVDIDGTLSNLEHRLHYIQKETKDKNSFFASVKDDLPVPATISVVQALADCYDIVFCSGRPERCREATIAWLKSHVHLWKPLYMRKDGDHREDYLVKEELKELIEEKYKIVAVIDDRQRVVDMWRRHGILCLQCAPGNF